MHSDNQGAVHIVDIGSPNAELHSTAVDIFDFCRNFNVRCGFPKSLILVLMISATLSFSMTGILPRFFFCPFRSYLGPPYFR